MMAHNRLSAAHRRTAMIVAVVEFDNSLIFRVGRRLDAQAGGSCIYDRSEMSEISERLCAHNKHGSSFCSST